jgi:hypothetical protein
VQFKNLLRRAKRMRQYTYMGVRLCHMCPAANAASLYKPELCCLIASDSFTLASLLFHFSNLGTHSSSQRAGRERDFILGRQASTFGSTRCIEFCHTCINNTPHVKKNARRMTTTNMMGIMFSCKNL